MVPALFPGVQQTGAPSDRWRSAQKRQGHLPAAPRLLALGWMLNTEENQSLSSPALSGVGERLEDVSLNAPSTCSETTHGTRTETKYTSDKPELLLWNVVCVVWGRVKAQIMAASWNDCLGIIMSMKGSDSIKANCGCFCKNNGIRVTNFSPFRNLTRRRSHLALRRLSLLRPTAVSHTASRGMGPTRRAVN